MGLSSWQNRIVTADYKSRQLVLTGPGTGKTHCLIERLKYLVNTENLNPGVDILVLSFSVAAIKEVRKRLDVAVKAGECDIRVLYANIRTFDSFASHFMIRIDSEISFVNKSYDERINIAIKLISENKDVQDELRRYKHVLIDEIQDLVGVRARLSQCVLQHCGGGFTLFGDPAQAIFEYLVKKNEDGPTSVQFVNWIKQLFGNITIIDDINDDKDLKNYRVGENASLKEIASTGRFLIMEETQAEASRELIRYFNSLKILGCLNNHRIPAAYLNPETVVLCRTNGQVLCLARHFFEEKVEFSIRRRLEERIISPWVGRILFGFDSQKMDKKQFVELYEKKCGDGRLTADEAWQQIKDTEGSRTRDSIDIMELRKGLIGGPLYIQSPDREVDETGIVLSTIHRAKGREFKTVIVVIPDDQFWGNPNEIIEEGRVLYVALTRAKNELFKMSERGTGGFRQGLDERTIRSHGNRITGIEVGFAEDVNPHSFVSSRLHRCMEDIRLNQEDLWGKIKKRAEAQLVIATRSRFPIYEIRVKIESDFITIGETSESFGRSLYGCIKDINGRPPQFEHFPMSISSLWVREVVTETGSLGIEDVPRQLRTSGIWLGLRLEGVGKFNSN